MKGYLLTIALVFLLFSMAAFFGQEVANKDEQIKQLEQSLTEQIQEVEVYRSILETYQTEGIINE